MNRVIGLLAFLLLVIPCQAEIIIVDPNGSADFTKIQDAIDYSWHGDTIIVRPATYGGQINFNGTAITLTSTNPDDPNVVNSTKISKTGGDYSVIFAFEEDCNSVLTGFTISGTPILCNGSSPTITKNIIINCQSEGGGGAIRGESDASPEISYNIIMNNRVGCGVDDIAYGGAIYNCNGLISHNIIVGNAAYAYGSGRNFYARGGALCQCSGTIVNNVIVGNRLYGSVYNGGKYYLYGAGLYNCGGIVQNNIIVNNFMPDNSLTDGGGVYGSCQNSYNDIWGNVPNNFAGGASVGIGDISRDPLFLDNGHWEDQGHPKTDIWVNGDYHLKSSAGRWDPNTQSWVIDDVNSRCIDAGNPSDIIGVEPNPNGSRINQGAYGGTAEASKSPSGIVEPVCSNPPLMDTNNDCKIDFIDFAKFATQWMDCGLDPPEACWE